MGKQMTEKQAALCYYYRNPPKDSGAKKTKFSKLPALVAAPGKPKPSISACKMAVARFHNSGPGRGRPAGSRKTSAAEDKVILSTFLKVRLPLGSAVDSRIVYNALPDALRKKICVRTVRERLREKGYAMDDKKAGDDKGELWRKRRLAFCRTHQAKTPARWTNSLQAVGDFRLFTYYPKHMKKKHQVKSCQRTIMRKGEKNKPAFLKPKYKVFTQSEFKRAQRAKVFGLTTSSGQSLVIPSPLYPESSDWVGMVHQHVGPFLRQAFPDKASVVILLDGETIMRTKEAKAALKEYGIKMLPNWPAHSPDINPQENVWAWAEKKLRVSEKKSDSFSVFKRRIIATSKLYPSGVKLVPGLAGRIATCIARHGAKIGK